VKPVTDRLAAAPQQWVAFVAVAAQFFLIVQLVTQFHLESRTFSRVMTLTFAGFLIHHFLPHRFRLPFFGLLSIAATVAVIDPLPGGILLAIGAVLIGICHLPVAFGIRVAILGAVGIALSVARVSPAAFPGLGAMWPILGSMFGLRILIYLYDLKHRSAPFSVTRATTYFFMVPNVCFPLFPVVDYKTFCTTYYDDEPTRIYQTGIRWMFRGVVQLLIYRLVYHFGLLNIEDVLDARDAAEFMLATYLLYLHVSGQFHLIVGLLHMFGFNLPETHHLYLLASSFTDFWRRINIYWKDFIMKIFFYPAFFALRKIGTLRALALATVGSFLATWVLHSWQWFWFRGRFLVTWQDISFWTILALLVLINALIEAVAGRRRSLGPPRFDLRARLIVGLKTIATFIVICSLWTLWSCQSASELRVLAESALRGSFADYAMILAGLLGIGVAGMIWGSTSREESRGKSAAAALRSPRHFWRSAAAVGAGSACLLALPVLAPIVSGKEGPTRLLTALREDQLNGGDMDRQRRGYYEELDDVRANQIQWDRGQVAAPPNWETKALYRDRDDFLLREMVPSKSAVTSGALMSTNRWGMRDRDYEREAPRGTYRIVLVGSSHEVGFGVEDQATFENLVEDRLNEGSSASKATRFEILNLSVGGYGIARKLARLERDGLPFEPDAVIFAVNTADRGFDRSDLATILRQDRRVPYDELKAIYRRAEVDANMLDFEIRRRLKPFIPDLQAWAFRRLAELGASRGIRVFVLFRPSPIDSADGPTEREALIRTARAAGLEVLDLTPAFGQVSDLNTLRVAPWDIHTNAAGHRLLADELHSQLEPLLRSERVRPPAEPAP
jgi:hypothetical protein